MTTQTKTLTVREEDGWQLLADAGDYATAYLYVEEGGAVELYAGEAEPDAKANGMPLHQSCPGHPMIRLALESSTQLWLRGRHGRVVLIGQGGTGSDVAPTVVTPVSISGTAQVGETLTAAPGVYAGNPAPTTATKWEVSADGESDWAAIPGADAATYEAAPEDEGQYLSALETATNDAGTVTSRSNVIGPIAAA
jgi:hypothetical protein